MEWNLAAYPKQCPEALQHAYFGLYACRLNNNRCLLETGEDCPTYEDWLFEERQKELDQVGKEEEYGYGNG